MKVLRRDVYILLAGVGTSTIGHFAVGWVLGDLSVETPEGSCVSPLLRIGLFFLVGLSAPLLNRERPWESTAFMAAGVFVVQAAIALATPSNLWPVVVFLVLVVAVIPVIAGGALMTVLIRSDGRRLAG